MKCTKCGSRNVAHRSIPIFGDENLGIMHDFGKCNDCGESGQHLIEDCPCILCGWIDGEHASECLHYLQFDVPADANIGTLSEEDAMYRTWDIR